METEEERGHETVRTDVKNWPEDQEICFDLNVQVARNHGSLSYNVSEILW